MRSIPLQERRAASADRRDRESGTGGACAKLDMRQLGYEFVVRRTRARGGRVPRGVARRWRAQRAASLQDGVGMCSLAMQHSTSVGCRIICCLPPCAGYRV